MYLIVSYHFIIVHLLILLLFQAENVSYSPSIVPACLPIPYQNTTELAALLEAPDRWPVVVGWGATHTFGPAVTQLRQATVPM